MENQETKHNIKEQILQKIQNGEVKMRPKAFFVMKIAILIFISFVTFVLSVLVVSYTWFVLRAGGHIFLLGFGGRGFFEFVLLFPWLILLLDIALIFLLDWLIKKFKFGYHNPVLYIFVGSLLIITVSGSVINMTSFHKNILRMAESRHFPIPGVSMFYSGLRRIHPENGIFRGEVISIATSSFVINNSKDDAEENPQDILIFIPEGFDVATLLTVGDEVFVAGDVGLDGSVRAYGIKKLTVDD